MTADDRKALGPDGVALAEALGCVAYNREPQTFREWQTAIYAWAGSVDGDSPPPCPLDAEGARGTAFPLTREPVQDLIAELRRTRRDRDAARQELAAARAESALRLHELRLLLGALRDWFDVLDLVGHADGIAPAAHALDAAARRAWDFHRAEAAMLPALERLRSEGGDK